MAAPCEACTASDEEEEHLGASESELQDARVEAEIEVVFAHLAQPVGVLVGLADEVRRDRAVELITTGSLSLVSQVSGAIMTTARREKVRTSSDCSRRSSLSRELRDCLALYKSSSAWRVRDTA
jgi:hypothetical protein